MSVSRSDREVHGVGCRQNTLCNLTIRALQRLPRGSEARGAGPACSSVNAPRPCRTWSLCCTQHLNLRWLRGLRVHRLRESSTARPSRTQRFTLFLLIISNFSLASYFRAKVWRGISDIIALGMYFGQTENKCLIKLIRGLQLIFKSSRSIVCHNEQLRQAEENFCISSSKFWMRSAVPQVASQLRRLLVL